jgi:hypothetical protein
MVGLLVGVALVVMAVVLGVLPVPADPLIGTTLTVLVRWYLSRPCWWRRSQWLYRTCSGRRAAHGRVNLENCPAYVARILDILPVE